MKAISITIYVHEQQASKWRNWNVNEAEKMTKWILMKSKSLPQLLCFWSSKQAEKRRNSSNLTALFWFRFESWVERVWWGLVASVTGVIEDFEREEKLRLKSFCEKNINFIYLFLSSAGNFFHCEIDTSRSSLAFLISSKLRSSTGN